MRLEKKGDEFHAYFSLMNLREVYSAARSIADSEWKLINAMKTFGTAANSQVWV